MKRCKLSIALLTTGIILALALPAVAQEKLNKRPQLAFRIGGGAAYVTEIEEWENAISTGLTFLVPISQHFKIFVDTSFFNMYGDGDPQPTRNIFYTGAGLDYASGRQGFFGGASIGFGSLVYDYDYDENSGRIQQGGVGFNIHSGYFFKLSDKVGLGPRLEYSYLDVGTQPSIGYLNDYKITPNWWSLSLAVQFP